MRFKRSEFILSQLRNDIVRYRVLTLLLLGIIAILAFALAQKRDKTIILPPDRSKYILEEFPAHYIEGFALSWSKILFDYTPSNCFARSTEIARHSSNQAVIRRVDVENEFIRKEKVSQKFYPKKLEVKKDKVLFWGSISRQQGENELNKEVKIIMDVVQGALGQPLLKGWEIREVKK